MESTAAVPEKDPDAKDLEVSIVPVYGNRDGILTIVSDDGNLETGMLLNELTRKFQLPVTIGGYVTNIGLYLPWWEKTLQGNPLLELVNHSYNHVRMGEGTEISGNRRRLRHEILHAQQFFENRFGEKQICFICPENQMCAAGYELLEEGGIVAVRKGDRGFNDLAPPEGRQPGELYNLKCMGIMDVSGPDSETVRAAWLGTAAEEHRWLIEMWHNVAESDDGGYQTIRKEDAEKHLAAIRQFAEDGRLWCAKLTDAVKYIVERKHVTVNAAADKKELRLIADAGTLPPDVFDHPLTICVRLPDGVLLKEKTETITQAGSEWVQTEIVPGEMKVFPFEYDPA